MADSVVNVALAIGGSIELSIIVKATVVLVVALTAARLARRSRAAVRHTLLACAFGTLLALPFATLLMPQVTVEIPVSDVRPLAAPATAAVEVESATGTIGTDPSSSAATRGWMSFSASTLLRVGWALGAMFFLVPLVGAFWRLRRLRQTGLPWVKGQTLAGELAREAGVNRSIDVLLHEHISAPMTCGLVHPLIVLPADVGDWSDGDLQRAIVHELEHVHRADWPVHLLARVVCLTYWFNPLVWTAWRRLCLEAERACDDAVLRGADRTAYAEQLVSLARRLVNRDARPMLSMASRSDLSARIVAVLDMHQPRGRAETAQMMMIVVAAVGLMLAISPLEAVSRTAGPSQPLQESPSFPPGSPAFEVASVKPNKSGDQRFSMEPLPGGRITVVNAPLRLLVRLAYGLQDFQIVDAPGWLNSDRFDIVAKADGDATQAQLTLMVRTLLADRFKLRTHKETREVPIYSLVTVKSDRTTGPQLRPAEPCVQSSEKTPPQSPSSLGPVPCGFRVGPGATSARGVTMDALAFTLSNQVGRVVLDRTGLTGQFDLTFEWALPLAGTSDSSQSFADGASIFTALQEQLGLKLESARGPVEVLVIDSVQQPTSDEIGLTAGQPPPLVAQSSAPVVPGQTFEVASIKPNKSADPPGRVSPEPGGRFTVVNKTLKALIAYAYMVPEFGVLGGPGWVSSDRFDLLAKGDFTFAGDPRIGLMLRGLLAERSKLAVHTETRELPIYALVMADRDGKIGPRLHKSDVDCAAIMKERGLGIPPPPPPRGRGPLCMGIVGPGRMSESGTTMPNLAATLARLVGRPVRDRTGLSGGFDVDLEWMPDLQLPALDDGRNPPSVTIEGPTIFTALQDQLGLRLESTRGPVNVVVIDSVERPTPD